MVLDVGRIVSLLPSRALPPQSQHKNLKKVEFDKPSELLKMENGRFRSLVDESGDRDLLYSMASHGGTTTTMTASP